MIWFPAHHNVIPLKYGLLTICGETSASVQNFLNNKDPIRIKRPLLRGAKYFCLIVVPLPNLKWCASKFALILSYLSYLENVKAKIHRCLAKTWSRTCLWMKPTGKTAAMLG